MYQVLQRRVWESEMMLRDRVQVRKTLSHFSQLNLSALIPLLMLRPLSLLITALISYHTVSFLTPCFISCTYRRWKTVRGLTIQ